jgi:2-polyprenyl-3-methyl-5-hydroxy-6-metoxy-1,4-benzoquinol methylase
MKRIGDTIKIEGSYQYKALTQGNAIQRFWHYSKSQAISRFLPPKRGDFVLDVGCGSVVISAFLAQSGAEVLAVDSNLEAIQFATEFYSNTSIHFRRGFVDEQFKLEKSASKIYCLEVIEHIYFSQAEDMLKVFGGVLSSNGKVFLTTPNYHSYWPLLEWFLDKTHLTPRMKDDQHVAHYHPRKLRQLCEKVGFKVKLLTSMCFLAPWVAPMSSRLARWIGQWEMKWPFPWGCILIIVLEKDSSDESNR